MSLSTYRISLESASSFGGMYCFHPHGRCPGYEPICSSSQVLVITRLRGVMSYITINIQFCLFLSYKQHIPYAKPIVLNYLLAYVLNYLLTYLLTHLLHGAEFFLIS